MEYRDPYERENHRFDFNRKTKFPSENNQNKPQQKVTKQIKQPRCVVSNVMSEKAPIRISLNKVNDYLKEDPDKILLKIQDKYFGLDAYLESDRMGVDLIKSFSSLLLKAFECNSLRINKTDIITTLSDSKFYKQILYEAIQQKKKNGEYEIELIKNAIDLTLEILYINPAKKIMLEFMIDRLEVICCLRSKDMELNKHYELLVEFLKKKEEIEKVKEVTRYSENITDPAAEPPTKFIELTILPTLYDIITDDKPFLRQNVTNGAYKSVEHYLDVQFRLLREDFIQPLREGVKQLRVIIDSERAKQKEKFKINKELQFKLMKEINSINIYYDIQMISNVLTQAGIVYSMRLSLATNKKIDWERSKRLIYGSLVCFSKDYFQTHCIVGTVCERDVRKLEEEGNIYIKFDHSTDFSSLPRVDESYIMIEASAYFESYKSVLEAFVSFQFKGEEVFPFLDNIVYCKNTEMPAPEYLNNAYVDFRCLIDKKKKIIFDKLSNQNKYEFDRSIDFAQNVLIKNENAWPSASQLEFDSSQYNALKLALTNKLALIQGPPGCGKTFLGVKLVELLLNNKNLWWKKDGQRSRPILMICYTNHALDQFLELVVDKCELKSGIVRVGGRSKSQKLEPFLLRKIKTDLRKQRKFDAQIYYRFRDALDNLELIKNNIQGSIQNLDECNNGVVSMKYLEKVIDEKLRAQFIDNSLYNSRNIFDKAVQLNLNLLKWLGFFDELTDKINEIDSQLDKLNLSAKEVKEERQEEEEEEETDTEDDSDDEERMLDDEFDIHSDIKKLKQIRKNESEKSVKNLNESYIQTLQKCDIVINQSVLNQITKANSDGWKQAGKNKNKKGSMLFRLIRKFSNEKREKEIDSSDLWSMNYEDRYILYNKWLTELRLYFQKEISLLQDNYNKSAIGLQEIRMQEDKFIMENSLIIAMTTTGSARYHQILNDIGPRIVIVEEAAEVFEAHIVSALSCKCEHLILIGDHLQLRPNPTVYSLAKDYKVDVSLFERLLNNNCKKEMLSVQHRMRPEISVLMRHFYGNNTIKDHEHVLGFASIRGLAKNIFFIEHSHPERKTDGTSKINEYEAEYLSAFTNYLVKQHYEESQITILTMYLGQLFEIRNILRKKYKLKNVKVSTVDNFQGEENEIILLSLVRSNKEKKIGFLSIENRVNVALSRAKQGLYVIGNFPFIGDQNKTWNDIIKRMKDLNQYGNQLTLSCGKHPENDMIVSNIGDFELRPEGGCKQACNSRLKCGHTCRLLCHTYSHDGYVCRATCNKFIGNCGHNCQKKCGHKNDCGFECTMLVEKKVPECGHTTMIKCHEKPVRKNCNKECGLYLPCGHNCINSCNEIPCKPCCKLIQVDSVCSHKGLIEVKCSHLKFEWQMACKKKCDQKLECGHVCSGICGKDCFSGLLHRNCSAPCDKTLPCGHKCTEKCSDKCSPCKMNCTNKCSHSQCKKECGLKCDKCMEKCPVKCKHKECPYACYQQCDIEPCNESCDMKLTCGHKCMGLCGEKCPDICFKCNKKNSIIDPTFLVLVDCNHTFEKNIIDNWVEMNFEKHQSLKLPLCPKCESEILTTKRYIGYVRRYNQAITLVKNKQFGSPVELNFQKRRIREKIKKLENILEDHSFLKKLDKRLNDQDDLSAYQLDFLSKKIDLFLNLSDLHKSFKTKFNSIANYLGLFNFEYEKLKSHLISNKQNNSIQIAKQEIDDLSNEIQRLRKIFEFFQVEIYIQKQIVYLNLNTQASVEASKLMKNLEELLIVKCNPFFKVENNVATLFDLVYKLLKISKETIQS